MVWGGHRKAAVRMAVWVQHGLLVAVRDVPLHVGVEAGGPIVGHVRLAEVDQAEVVDDVPAAQDQHALVPQCAQPAPQLQVVAWRFGRVD